MAMDPLIARRLLLAKQLYLHAVVQASRTSLSFRRIIAVITLDLAVETLIKIVIGFLDPKKTPKDDFSSLLNQLDSLFDTKGYGKIPQRANILHVHSLRNDAQHKGKYPNEQNIEESLVFVRTFLDETLRMIWERSLESISIAEAIRDNSVKSLVLQAEDSLEADDFSNVVKYSNAAFSLAMDYARRQLFPGSHRRLSQSFGPVQWNIGLRSGPPRLDNSLRLVQSALDKLHKELKRDISSVRNDVATLRKDTKDELDLLEGMIVLPLLGISHSNFLEFKKLSGHVRFTSREDLKFDVRGMKQDPDQSEAEFVLAFSSEVIIEIQDRVGDRY